jgi:predicted lysophospholipase L1 biosynthesis ABC-type transport system permease subunit
MNPAWKLAAIATKMMWGARARSALSILSLALSLSVPLSLELGITAFERLLRDEEGRWLGADLVLLAREPIEELAAAPRILETVANVNGHALHVKVTDTAKDGAWVAKDTAALLGIRPGERFPFGKISLLFRHTLIDEPDRLIGLASSLPRLLISHQDWERSDLGLHANPPEYRYLFPHPSAGKKEELLRLYPGAIVLAKEDRFAGAEANSSQVYVFLRAGAACAAILGLAGLFLLSKLRAAEECQNTANLKLLGATPRTLRRIATYRHLWTLGLSSVLGIPLCYALLQALCLRVGYFSPYSRLDVSPSLSFVTVWLGAVIFVHVLLRKAEATMLLQRPASLLGRQAQDVSRLQRRAMFIVLAFATAASGALVIAYWEFIPVFARSAFPSEDGVLVIGDGPPGDSELQSVWARVQAKGGSPQTALATCEATRNGAILEKSFASRLKILPGEDLSVTVGRLSRRLRVEGIENARGVAQYLRQMVIPCTLAEGLPPFRLAWHAGPAESLLRRLPSTSAKLSAAELRGRVEDLASRAIFFPQLCAIYVSAMSLLIATATWRMILLARRNDLAIWRVCGASRQTVEHRIIGESSLALTTSLACGSLAAWLAAATLLSYLTGTPVRPPLYWIPLTGTIWGAIVLAIWRWQLNLLLRERPMEILRAK